MILCDTLDVRLPMQLVEGAEAKAYYGLAVNYAALQALIERLLVKETLSGKEVTETLEGAGVIKFPDSYLAGFGWAPSGGLVYPGMPEEVGGRMRKMTLSKSLCSPCLLTQMQGSPSA